MLGFRPFASAPLASSPAVVPFIVQVTLDATEVNGDVMRMVVSTLFQNAATAIVSIEEIRVSQSAATSIREP